MRRRAIGRLILAAVLCGSVAGPAGGPALAQPAPAGQVDRVQGQATASRSAGTFTLQAGDPVYMDDILATALAARLTVMFRDGQSLTMGENGEILIDEYVYGEAGADASILTWTAGAFLTTTGAIGKATPEAVLVQTPVVTIGIRGTQFWGGRLESDFEVLVLEGRVIVFNAAGTVELNPGETTAVAAADSAPAPPSVMPDDRRTRAFATVQYGN